MKEIIRTGLYFVTHRNLLQSTCAGLVEELSIFFLKWRIASSESGRVIRYQCFFDITRSVGSRALTGLFKSFVVASVTFAIKKVSWSFA